MFKRRLICLKKMYKNGNQSLHIVIRKRFRKNTTEIKNGRFFPNTIFTYFCDFCSITVVCVVI